MAGNDDDLLGMLAAFEIGDHVVAFHIRQYLRRERQVHSNRCLSRKVSNQLRILGGYGSSRNLWGIVGIAEGAGMRKPIVGGSNGPYQRSYRAQTRSFTGACAAINHSFAVRIEAVSLGRHSFVEASIEQNNFPGHLFTAKRVKLIKAVDDDHLGGQALGGSGDAATKRGQGDSLSRSRRLPCELDQLSGLRAARPMRHHDSLKLNFQTKTAQLCGDIPNGVLSLRRTAQARADVV